MKKEENEEEEEAEEERGDEKGVDGSHKKSPARRLAFKI